MTIAATMPISRPALVPLLDLAFAGDGSGNRSSGQLA